MAVEVLDTLGMKCPQPVWKIALCLWGRPLVLQFWPMFFGVCFARNRRGNVSHKDSRRGRPGLVIETLQSIPRFYLFVINRPAAKIKDIRCMFKSSQTFIKIRLEHISNLLRIGHAKGLIEKISERTDIRGS
jgi:hypothetical protein